MDKVIKHRFWILLALVPILSIFGYYKANAALNEARQAREDVLRKLNVPTGNEPNPKWTKAEFGGLEAQNEVIRRQLNAQIVRLWDHQQERMVWPQEMQQYLPEEGYRGPFSREAGFVYRSVYPDEIEDLYAVAEPIVLAANEVRGKVFLDRSVIPEHEFDQQAMRSEDIWNAEEDVWFLTLLLEAVRNVNEDAPNAAKAVVRKIYEVRLVGGDGESTVKKSGGGGGGADAAIPGGMPGGPDAAMMQELNQGGRRDGPGGDFSGGGAVGFDPSEEFGSDKKAGSGSSSAAPAGDPAAMATSNSRPAKAEQLRYIKLDESAPFRERGFYLEVLIDQTKIADFLVELSNAEWPIRIVRFHVGPNPETGTGQSGLLGGDLNAAFPDLAAPGPAGAGVPGLDSGDAFAPPGRNYGPGQMLSQDEFAGLLTHPDLVQLAVAGAITFYHPPSEELLASLEAEESGSSGVSDGETVQPESDSNEAAAVEDDSVETETSPDESSPDGELPPADAANEE